MAEEKKQLNDEELSKLLDSTLSEFGKPKRTTDDELDELMAVQDQAAAQKAAGDFHNMLNQMVQVQEEAMKRAEQGEGPVGADGVDPNDPEGLAMMDALKQLMECSSKISNANSAEEFMTGLEMLRSPDSPMEGFMGMIMQTLASKEMMYPPLKEIHTSFPKYLEEHAAELDQETKERYEKQYEVLGRICTEFESQTEGELSTEPTEVPKAAEDEAQVAKDMESFEKLGKLLMELQSHGYPPKELVGDLPAGWGIDNSTGLPTVETPSVAADACSIQ